MSRVLVLEPDRDVLGLFARLLRRLGHEVVDEGGDGDVDIVLLEPASEFALRTLEAVRARVPDVFVVCVSIYPREAVADVIPNAYLSKPISVSVLEAVVGRVCIADS